MKLKLAERLKIQNTWHTRCLKMTILRVIGSSLDTGLSLSLAFSGRLKCFYIKFIIEMVFDAYCGTIENYGHTKTMKCYTIACREC